MPNWILIIRSQCYTLKRAWLVAMPSHCTDSSSFSVSWCTGHQRVNWLSVCVLTKLWKWSTLPRIHHPHLFLESMPCGSRNWIILIHICRTNFLADVLCLVIGIANSSSDSGQNCRVLYIGAGRILKVEGHSGGSNYFGAAEKIFWCPLLFSCAHPVFDGIRGTTIKVKQF